MDSNPFRAEHERMQQEARKPPRSDHVEAAIEGLEMFKKALRGGKPPEEVGPALDLFARLLSRRT